MLPLAFNVLSLEEIAEYWSREIAGVRTMAEMYAELLSAFWRDDLTVFGSSGKVPVDRRRFLELVRRESVHPGFTLVDSAGVIPPAIEKQFGRSIIIDTTTYVVLPSDHSDWTDDIVETAYRRLATMSFEDFHDVLKPGLRALSTTREELRNFCAMKGYDLPRFWFRATKERPVSFGGRSSVMRQIRAEMTRRAERQVLAPTLREEVKALLIWAQAHIDETIQLPKQQATENAL